jgi:hypothetical protein
MDAVKAARALRSSVPETKPQKPKHHRKMAYGDKLNTHGSVLPPLRVKTPPTNPISTRNTKKCVEDPILLEAAVCSFLNGSLKAIDAADSINMPIKQFYRMKERFAQKGSVTKVGNNPPLLDAEAERDIMVESTRRAMEGSGYSRLRPFVATLETKWRDTLRRRGNVGWETAPFVIGKSTLYSYEEQFVSETMRRADSQNLQRSLNRINIVVPITAAATMFSVLRGLNGGMWPQDQTAVRPQMVSCRDTKSLDLQPKFDNKNAVKVPAGTNKALRGEHFGVKCLSGCDVDLTPLPGSTYVTPPSSPDSTSSSESFARGTVDHCKYTAEALYLSKKAICELPHTRTTKGGTLAHRGAALDFTTIASGQLKIIMVTLKENTMTTYSLHKICGHCAHGIEMYMIMRPKEVNEVQLELDKLEFIFYPAMERQRQGVMAQADVPIHLHGLIRTGENLLQPSIPETDPPLPRMVHTLDGCGPPLIAAMRFHEDSYYKDKCPANTSDVKNPNAGTHLFQLNDAAKSHGILQSHYSTDFNVIREGEEGRLPPYMPLVDKILKSSGCEPSAQRTYFKLMANLMHWSEDAFSYQHITSGARLCSLFPMSLGAFIRRWAGKSVLTDEDLETVIRAFPALVDVADARGTVNQQTAEDILGDFIDEVHEKGLSTEALVLLAAQALKKPQSERPLNQQGMTHLNNDGLLEDRRKDILLRNAKGVAALETNLCKLRIESLVAALGITRCVKESKDKDMFTEMTARTKSLHVRATCLFLSEADQLSLRSCCTTAFNALSPLTTLIFPTSMTNTTKANRLGKFPARPIVVEYE